MKVISIISDEKELALKEDNIQRLERLIELGLLDVNTLSFSGHSLLLEAGYYEAKKIIDFIVSSKDLDLKSTNVNGHNVIEELRFFGKVEIANYIEKKLGKIKFKKIDFKERHISKTSIYPNGSPILDWVRIKPGSFKMGNQQKIPVKLTKAFNLMSVDTTQRMWKGIVELIKLNSLPQAEFLNEDPSHFKGLDKPVESISQSDVNHWLNGLNLLSNIESGEIQKKLLELFPGHYLGKNYRLPTAAEWEYVTRIEGLATSDYVFGATYLNINEYAWFSKNSNGETHPVGQKKPILINGKPVYDIQGNVSKRVQDLWDGKNILLGGIDPVGTRGTFNMTIGGAWYHVEQGLILGRFSPTRGDIRSNQIGIRLVSDVP